MKEPRCDWRSLFVYDPKTEITSLVKGATLEDVAERHENYLRWIWDMPPSVTTDREPRP